MGACAGPVVSRRTLLAAAAVLPLAACTDDGPPPPPDPDDVLREQAVGRERSLLREYDAVLLVLPALAARLTPLRAEHAEHLAALTGPEPSDTPFDTPSAPASSRPAPAVPPAATAAAALEGLTIAEREAAIAHGAACLEASRELAGLLAALAASEFSHPVALA
ncbi:MAG: hypothetical protein WD794_01070 [Mycobacteriales bacterium]